MNSNSKTHICEKCADLVSIGGYYQTKDYFITKNVAIKKINGEAVQIDLPELGEICTYENDVYSFDTEKKLIWHINLDTGEKSKLEFNQNTRPGHFFLSALPYHRAEYYPQCNSKYIIYMNDDNLWIIDLATGKNIKLRDSDSEEIRVEHGTVLLKDEYVFFVSRILGKYDTGIYKYHIPTGKIVGLCALEGVLEGSEFKYNKTEALNYDEILSELYEGKIYCMAYDEEEYTEKLYIIDLSNGKITEDEIYFECEPEEIEYMTVQDNVIYYYTQFGQFLKYDINTEVNTLLEKKSLFDMTYSSLYVVGDWIYYDDHDDNTHRISVYGGNHVVIERS